MKKIITGTSLLLALVLPASAMAACNYTTEIYSRVVNGPFQFVFDPFTISIDPNIPVGGVLARQTISQRKVLDADGNLWSSAGLVCDTPLVTVDANVTSGPLTALPNVYETGIPGIGLRIVESGRPLSVWPLSWFYSSSTKVLVNPTTELDLEFVKTGPITGGGAISGNVAQYIATGPGVVIVGMGPSSPIIVVPAVPTCSTTTPDVLVNLDAADVGGFATTGSTLSEKAFNVSLSCSGGNAGTKTSVFMSLADQTTPANTTQTLSLTSASTATGVGVQVLRNDVPISWVSSTNRFKVQDVLPGNSTVDIPFKARYIRTGAMTAGLVQGIATFTMEYQ